MIPHDNWASVYDQVYTNTFGGFLDDLTKVTMATISGIKKAPAKLLDIGAGTGRLAIPMAQAGYNVTAIEPSGEMLNILKDKANKLNLSLIYIQQKMEELNQGGPFDVAISVFSVLIYILDHGTLDKSFLAVANILQPGGHLLFDIPQSRLFRSYESKSPEMRRKVKITPTDTSLFSYEESIALLVDGIWKDFTDQFLIRLWSINEVQSSLEKAGFKVVRDFNDTFFNSGSDYFLAVKI